MKYNHMNEEKEQGLFQGKVMEKLNNIEALLTHKVDREEFTPVKTIAYGLVGLVLTMVFTALIAQVVKAL